MGSASRILSSVFALLATTGAAHLSSRTSIGELSGASIHGRAKPDDGGSNWQAVSPDQKPHDEGPPAQTSDKPDQTSGSETPTSDSGRLQDQAAGHPTEKKDAAKNAKNSQKVAAKQPQKVTPRATTRTATGGRNAIHEAARQVLDSLDVAIGIAQNSAPPGSSSPSSTQIDDISVRRNELLQKAKAANDDDAWAGVLTGAAGLLTETLNLVKASPSNPGASGQVSGVQSGMNHEATPQGAERKRFFQSPQLALCVAGLSLVFSILGLGSGWLLARHKINQALTEAGLL